MYFASAVGTEADGIVRRNGRLLAGSENLQRVLRMRSQVEAILPGGARVTEDPGALSDLFLFHGTDPETAGKIAQHGFDERVSGDRGMYGMGSYFTDHSCKAHQYTGYLRESCEPALTAEGEHCMLLCRVQMGAVHATTVTHSKDR